MIYTLKQKIKIMSIEVNSIGNRVKNLKLNTKLLKLSLMFYKYRINSGKLILLGWRRKI